MMQKALSLIYPARCLLCSAMTEQDFALCGACWRDTPFIDGLTCHGCGAPLPGEGDGGSDVCDDCLTTARPWEAGRAAILYRDNGRRLVLGIKHGDRTDIARAAAKWLARSGTPLLEKDSILVPVPLHWTRLLRRKYNQSAVLARYLGRECGLPVLPDALVRIRRTASLGALSPEQRFVTLSDAIRPHPKRGTQIRGKCVVIIDDVMTSGATAAAATEAAHIAGAKRVCVLHLARATKGA